MRLFLYFFVFYWLNHPYWLVLVHKIRMFVNHYTWKGSYWQLTEGTCPARPVSSCVREEALYACANNTKVGTAWQLVSTRVNSYCFRSPLGARPVVIEDKRTKLFLDWLVKMLSPYPCASTRLVIVCFGILGLEWEMKNVWIRVSLNLIITHFTHTGRCREECCFTPMLVS